MTTGKLTGEQFEEIKQIAADHFWPHARPAGDMSEETGVRVVTDAKGVFLLALPHYNHQVNRRAAWRPPVSRIRVFLDGYRALDDGQEIIYDEATIPIDGNLGDILVEK